jgi:hypothetical protein
MEYKLPRFQKATVVFGAATGMLLCLPYSMHAQSSAPQDQQAAQSQDRQGGQADDITRRDLARFDQFLDGKPELGQELRKTPSLVDDPQFLQSNPELKTYLQDHPSVKQEISEHPDQFMKYAYDYARDKNLRDRDAGGQVSGGQNAGGQNAGGQNGNRDAGGQNAGGQNAGGQDRNADRREDANRTELQNFSRFLDDHREIAEQVRKDPRLLDREDFVHNHPALQTFLQDHPGVRDQIREHPDAFMHEEEAFNRDSSMRDRDPMHDHIADFGGFLRNHSDIRNDLSRDPSKVKDQSYLENHAELNAYLTAHPDVRSELMANPQTFVHGAAQYGGSSSGSGSGTGTTGSGTTGTGTTGSMTGTSATTPTTTHEPAKPNQ